MLEDSLIFVILGIVSIVGNFTCLLVMLRVLFLISGLDISKKTKIQIGIISFSCGVVLEIFILTSYVSVAMVEGYASVLFPKYRGLWFAAFLLHIISAIVLIAHTFSIRMFVPILALEVLPVLSGILFLIATSQSTKKGLKRIQAWSLACAIYSLLSGVAFILRSGTILNDILVLSAIILRDLIIATRMH